MWACGFRISFTPRFRGAFHLSLTVLCAIGSGMYLALAGGPARFHRDVACPGVLTYRPHSPPAFAYGALTRYGGPFQ